MKCENLRLGIALKQRSRQVLVLILKGQTSQVLEFGPILMIHPDTFWYGIDKIQDKYWSWSHTRLVVSQNSDHLISISKSCLVFWNIVCSKIASFFLLWPWQKQPLHEDWFHVGTAATNVDGDISFTLDP